MKLLNCTLTLVLFICSSTFAQKAEQTNRIIVKFKNEVVSSSVKRSIQPHDGNFYVFQLPKEANRESTIDELSKSSEVEYVEPDYIGSGGGMQGPTPNDPFFFRQWGLVNDGTFSLSPSVIGADIDMKKAWSIAQGDSNVVVGIIDSGNKLDHPEFSGRIWQNRKEIPDNGIDDDNNGYIDDVQGWDFVNADNDPTDDLGHGTNVTGILGANANNDIGYAGVDWKCKLMILKTLNDENNGYYSWFANAIYYAVNNGAKVINMSLGGTSVSKTLQNAVDYALSHQVTIVACMMNSNSNTVYYPAGIPGVIAVGSTNSNDSRTNPFFWSPTSGSSFGSHISVVAPGNFIYGLSYSSDTNYSSYWGGTSQATPLVTGLVSLLLSQDSARTPQQLKSIIELTAEDRVGDLSEDSVGWDPYYGYGRINAYKALSSTTNVIEKQVQKTNVTVYPNPFSAQTTVSADFIFNNATLTVINNSGQRVAVVENINGQSYVFNRGKLTRGVYYMVIAQKNQVLSINKVIVTD